MDRIESNVPQQYSVKGTLKLINSYIKFVNIKIFVFTVIYILIQSTIIYKHDTSVMPPTTKKYI